MSICSDTFSTNSNVLEVYYMIVLGIESSCDDSAVAIVDSNRNIISNQLFSQIEEHINFGGVVPEIAARSHMKMLPELMIRALNESCIPLDKLDGVAATAGPGLIGGVIVGLMFAKGIASAIKKPLIAMNHLEGHALSIRLLEDIQFPYLLMMLSGGHCQILIVEGIGTYKKLGQTKDDAVGEAFDKISKMLGLGYPGGPIIEKIAKTGDPHSFRLPMPLCSYRTCDFSFSGLKTAARHAILKLDLNNQKDVANMCASLQHTISEILAKKLDVAIEIFSSLYPHSKDVVIAGGVAANRYIYSKLENFCQSHGFTLHSPPIHLCTDNAAMIAWGGIERLKLGMHDNLDAIPRSKWSL